MKPINEEANKYLKECNIQSSSKRILQEILFYWSDISTFKELMKKKY